MRKAIPVLLLSGALSAFAAPMFFTFTGKIVMLPADQGGYSAAHGIKVGDPFTYVFEVDTTLPGYLVDNAGRTDNPDTLATGGGVRNDYFFDSLVTPSLYSAAVTDLASGSYFGYHTTRTLGTQEMNTAAFATTIGNNDEFTTIVVYIGKSTSAVYLPKIGDTVQVTEGYAKGSTASSSASLTMTLAAISDTKPNGIRSQTGAPQSWMRAGFRDGRFEIENLSGAPVHAAISDAMGRSAFSLTVGARASVPVLELPHGLFFLTMTTADRDLRETRLFIR